MKARVVFDLEDFLLNSTVMITLIAVKNMRFPNR